MPRSDEAELRAALGPKLREWAWSPLQFARDIIPWGADEGLATPYGPWVEMHGWMEDVLGELDAVLAQRREADPDRIGHVGVLISSGHGSGKSTALLPILTAWILLTKHNSRGIMTAPTDELLKSRAWGFTRALFESSALLKKFFLTSDKYISTRAAGIVREGMQPVHGIIPSCPSPSSNERLFGLHSDSCVFVMMEESEGVPDANYDAFTGTLTDKFSLHVAVGNPTRTTGFFADGVEDRGRFKGRWTIKRSIDIRSIPGMDTPQLREEIKNSGGEEGDFCRARVRGLVPRTSSTQFIPTQLCLDAQQRTRDWLEHRRRLGAGAPHPGEGYPIQCAVDLARGGPDHTVVMFRRGLDAGTFPIHREQGRRHTPMSLVLWLKNILDAPVGLDMPERPATMHADVSGTGGEVTFQLHQLGYRNVTGVVMQASSPALDCLNFRAYLWLKAKQFLEAGGMLPLGALGDQLVRELTLPEFSWDPRGQRLQIEDKQSLTQRNAGCSTDLADAFTILCHPPEHAVQQAYRSRYMRSAAGLAHLADRKRRSAAGVGRAWRGR